MDKPKEAKEQLAQAVDGFESSWRRTPTRWSCGNSWATRRPPSGDFQGASDAFDKAVALEPRNPSHYQKLARALEFQRRYEEAVAVVQKHMELMQEQGRRDVAAQLTQYMDMLKYKKVKQAK